MPHKKTNRKRHQNKSKSKTIKSNKRGGFLFNQGVNVAGVNLSRQTGEKVYNWKTGKWDNKVCYGVGPLKWCKIQTA